MKDIAHKGERANGKVRYRKYCYRYLDDVTMEDLSCYQMQVRKRPLRLKDGSCIEYPQRGIQHIEKKGKR